MPGRGLGGGGGGGGGHGGHHGGHHHHGGHGGGFVAVPGGWGWGPGYYEPSYGPDCPQVFDPVLATDGQVYDNECYARAAGRAVVRRVRKRGLSGAKVWKAAGDACCSSCASGGTCGSLGDASGGNSVFIALLGAGAIIYLVMKASKKAAAPAKW